MKRKNIKSSKLFLSYTVRVVFLKERISTVLHFILTYVKVSVRIIKKVCKEKITREIIRKSENFYFFVDCRLLLRVVNYDLNRKSCIL